MKLKLKVSKSLKRDLRLAAEKKELERTSFILQSLESFISNNQNIWQDKVDTYPELLVERENKLQVLKDELETTELSQEEIRQKLLAFYKDNHMYRVFYSKKKKFENIILNLDDSKYYALCLISESHGQAVELFTVEILSNLIKQP